MLLGKTPKLPEVIKWHKRVKQVDKQIKRRGKCFKAINDVPKPRRQVIEHENQSVCWLKCLQVGLGFKRLVLQMFSCLSFHVTGPIHHSAPAAPLSESSQSSSSPASLAWRTQRLLISSVFLSSFFWRGRLMFWCWKSKTTHCKRKCEVFSSTYSQLRSNVSLYHSSNVSHQKYLKKVQMRFMRVEIPGCESSEWIYCPTAMMMT